MPTCVMLGCLLMGAMELPSGPQPAALDFPPFPDRLHAYVWLNWPLVPADRLAEVVGATEEQLNAVAVSMGLPPQSVISPEVQRRAYITIIRRNWHLLPYEQLLRLLGWTSEQLAYTLREDDFLYIKLGSLKPKCAPLAYAPPSEETAGRAAAMAAIVAEEFPAGLANAGEPMFAFVAELSAPPSGDAPKAAPANKFHPRYCSSYFALYGDPLLGDTRDSFPDGYLARLAASGADGVWLQAVLYKLAEFPWDPSLSEGREQRLKNLAALVERARSHGLGVWLYLNEPRAMALPFFEKHPELKGATVGDHAMFCTSTPEVRAYLRGGVEAVCRAVPDLAGFFTISASENPTNCWSHGRGGECPRCSKAGAPAVIADLHAAFTEGIQASGAGTRLIAWDWGWSDEWAPAAINALPKQTALMSVSEWSLPIRRGGVETTVGEYSLSVDQPGPRATRHWGLARAAGLDTIAKIQANTTWELGCVPYVPAVANIARHAAKLRDAGVSGMMLGWTLGGCPSPNLDVVAGLGASDDSPEEVMAAVAARRYGAKLAPAAVDAWNSISAAFQEYPYHGGTVYSGPHHMGPANPLWTKPTGYKATMVGLPYDDLDSWRSVYPPGVFAAQFRKVADGFDAALAEMAEALKAAGVDEKEPGAAAFRDEMGVAEACAVHFRSVANQAAFVMERNSMLKDSTPAEEKKACAARMETLINSELSLAKRLYALQCADSRLGYEATNHYFYVPLDLAAKVVNCRLLLDGWLKEQAQ